MRSITPVLLCGGAGERLWPLSRQSFPKQFAPLTGTRSLFQQAATRLAGTGPGHHYSAPLVITASDYRFIATQQLAEAGIDPGAVLIEPEARNTAPAVLAAVIHASAANPDAMLLIAPSDHAIGDRDAFAAAVGQGLAAAEAGRIVTFGVAPDRPETGYGYLELAGRPDPAGGATDLRRFVEKPDAETAGAMIEAGNFLWNAGIFLASARSLIDAFHAHAPNLVRPVSQALARARPDLGFLRLDPSAWSDAEAISVDYAVMEKVAGLAVVPLTGGWSDLGGWDAVWREAGPDARGVALSDRALAIDCRDSLLRSEAEGTEIVGIGLRDVIAIAMPDAVLVADMGRAQDVRLAVEHLRGKGAAQATDHPRDHRPWGWFESLAIGDRFQVKRILVHPGAALSLQSHVHRSEHWVVVSGTARVQIDGEERLVSENQSVYVPVGARHRMENPGKVPMILIEVQTGPYVGEDDIVRYEDLYSRDPGE